MQEAHFIQKLYSRYYPKKSDISLNLQGCASDWEKLSFEEKEKLSYKYLQEGEMLLAKKDTAAIEYFNAAAGLNPNSEDVWYRQGKAFFIYGKLKNQEKALYLASKNFKIAVSLNEHRFEIWYNWGKTLAFLGNKTSETHYFFSAKEKYQKAIELSQTQKAEKEIIATIYWDYANLWMDIANQSEEAGDVRIAIQAYRISFAHQKTISSDFWYHFGKAYLQMGLFINDNRLYLEAIDYFNKALRVSKNHLDAWSSIAHAYTELYINTLDERCLKKADETYSKCLKISPHDSNLLLSWAQLLGEGGKITKDHKKLKLSVEKCIEADRLKNKKDPNIIGQWVESLSLLGAYTGSLDMILNAENKIIAATQKYHKIADLWYAYGICLGAFSIYYNDNEYDELAIEKFQIGLSIDRKNPELWHSLALSLTKIGNDNEDVYSLKRASKFLLRAIDLKPSCPLLTFDYGNLLLKLGELKEDQKILQEALFYLETTLNNQNDAILQHPDWLFTYGRILDLLGDCHDEENSYYKKALKAYQNVLLIDPDYPRLHYYIGLCYSHLAEITFDTQFYIQAINSFNLALKQNEEDDLVYLEWGLVLIALAEQGNDFEVNNHYFHEAEQKILRAGQLGNQHAYYHLGCLYSILNRFDESISFLVKAYKQDVLPPIEELLEDDWLENIRSTKDFANFLAIVDAKKNTVDGHSKFD